MKGITPTRLVIYGLLLGIVPLFFALTSYFTTQAKYQQLHVSLDDALQRAKTKAAKGFVNKQVKALFADTDHFYIDKQIETIKPLSAEIEFLQKTLSRGFHAEEDQLKRRLQFLTSGQNSISVVEGSVKAYPDFQETQETLAHPVEVDLPNLKALLSRIEGLSLDGEELPAGRPHLIIYEMKLDKKKSVAQEIYLLDLKFVKREYMK